MSNNTIGWLTTNWLQNDDDMQTTEMQKSPMQNHIKVFLPPLELYCLHCNSLLIDSSCSCITVNNLFCNDISNSESDEDNNVDMQENHKSISYRNYYKLMDKCIQLKEENDALQLQIKELKRKVDHNDRNIIKKIKLSGAQGVKFMTNQ